MNAKPSARELVSMWFNSYIVDPLRSSKSEFSLRCEVCGYETGWKRFMYRAEDAIEKHDCSLEYL